METDLYRTGDKQSCHIKFLKKAKQSVKKKGNAKKTITIFFLCFCLNYGEDLKKISKNLQNRSPKSLFLSQN